MSGKDQMLHEPENHTLLNIEFKIVYSGRRTLAISIFPDSSVIIRVPYRTSLKTINRLVQEKSAWIKKHQERYIEKEPSNLTRKYINGEMHLYRGKEYALKIEKSSKSYISFFDNVIELRLNNTNDPDEIKWVLYQGYKREASLLFPDILKRVLLKHDNQMFKPSGLIIRTMKRRWGSCSGKGVITLSTELIKLPDLYIEYVIIHELCHLKHHNHGSGYYKLLSEMFPEWKQVRQEMRRYIQ
jgi:predicted metal-dependent hydrolase